MTMPPPPSTEEVLSVLQRSRLSAGLSEETLRALAAAMSGMRFASGDILIRQGEPGSRLLLLTSGRVEVKVRTPAGTVATLATLGAGDCVGEMSLLTGDPAAAEVVAVEETQTLALERTEFGSLMLAHPQVVREFVRIISRRLGTTDAAVGAAREEEEQLAHFLRDEKADNYGDLVGKNALLGAVKAQVAKQAPLTSPLLVHGEKGTGKEAVARLVHFQGPRREAPLLSTECSHIGETPWGDKLFGARGGTTGPRSRSVCYMDLAEGGTILLGDIEALPPALQDRLAHYLAAPATGTQRVRVIATSQRSLAELATAGLITPALSAAFGGNAIAVPPLRDRKRDIPELAAHFALRCARRMNKAITGLDDRAQRKLVSYDYRIGNVQELLETVERAVVIADGPLIEAEEIFFRTAPAEAVRGVNFLAAPGSRTRLALRYVPGVLQGFVAVFFLGLLYLCFFGPAQAELNPATVLVWSVWWPALVLSFLLVGRVWCALCPMSLAGAGAQKLKNFKLRVPDWIKNHDLLIIGAGFVLIVWIEEVTGMRQSPFATGLLLLGIGAGAIVAGILFPRRTWCRHLCPLGGVAGLCSTSAAVEMRPTFDVCAAKCKGHFCYKGDDQTAGCPMFNHVMFVDSNQNCVLCLNCVHSCREGSPQLNLRIPARELWYGAGARLQSAALVAMLMGVVAALVLLQSWEHAATGWLPLLLREQRFAVVTAMLLAGALLPLAVLYLGLRRAGNQPDSPAASRLWRVVLALTPLVTAGFACYQLGFMPWLINLYAGLEYRTLDFIGPLQFSVTVLGLARATLLCLGLAGTISVLWKLSRPEADGTASIGLKMRALGLGGAAFYWTVLLIVFLTSEKLIV
jgi:transcriptional regulator with AAA-type ATPase domain